MNKCHYSKFLKKSFLDCPNPGAGNHTIIVLTVPTLCPLCRMSLVPNHNSQLHNSAHKSSKHIHTSSDPSSGKSQITTETEIIHFPLSSSNWRKSLQWRIFSDDPNPPSLSHSNHYELFPEESWNIWFWWSFIGGRVAMRNSNFLITFEPKLRRLVVLTVRVRSYDRRVTHWVPATSTGVLRM